MQNLLGTEKGMSAMLSCLEEFPKMVERLRAEWSDRSLTSAARWGRFLQAKKDLLPVCQGFT